jgi:hypothetical protein
VGIYEIDGQIIQGTYILIDVLKKSLIQPLLFALACSMASIICQPFAFTKGRLPFLGLIFLLKNMTALGFWILNLFIKPHIGYDD